MKTILILLCVLMLASCGSKSGKRAKAVSDKESSSTFVSQEVQFATDTAIITGIRDISPPQIISRDLIGAFIMSGKGRYIGKTIAVIKYSQYADSLVYWTYANDNYSWQFLDLK